MGKNPDTHWWKPEDPEQVLNAIQTIISLKTSSQSPRHGNCGARYKESWAVASSNTPCLEVVSIHPSKIKRENLDLHPRNRLVKFLWPSNGVCLTRSFL